MATTITQTPSKNDSQFITEATRVASILSKRTERPPRVSHSFESPKKRDARNRKRERERERERESERERRREREWTHTKRPLFESLFKRSSFILSEPNADIRRRFAAIKLVERTRRGEEYIRQARAKVLDGAVLPRKMTKLFKGYLRIPLVP